MINEEERALEEAKRIELVKQFATRFNAFLEENIKDSAQGLLIYKNEDFERWGLPQEWKKTHFIPVYHGLFYIGLFGITKEGWSVVGE